MPSLTASLPQLATISNVAPSPSKTTTPSSYLVLRLSISRTSSSRLAPGICAISKRIPLKTTKLSRNDLLRAEASLSLSVLISFCNLALSLRRCLSVSLISLIAPALSSEALFLKMLALLKTS